MGKHKQKKRSRFLSANTVRIAASIAVLSYVLCIGKSMLIESWASVTGATAVSQSAWLTFVVACSNDRCFKTLDTILRQSITSWKAVLVFHGIETEFGSSSMPSFIFPAQEYYNDTRITFVSLPSDVHGDKCFKSKYLHFARTDWAVVVSEGTLPHRSFIKRLSKEIAREKSKLILFNANFSDVREMATSLNERSDFAIQMTYLPFSGSRLLQDSCVALKCSVTRRGYYFQEGNGSPVQANAHQKSYPLTIRDEIVGAVTAKRLLHECLLQPRTDRVASPFVITETMDPYFKHNALGLKAALDKAWVNGCLEGWRKEDPIHVIFRADTIPISANYIQFQLEQHTSGFFSANYFAKLHAAKQIWEFSPRNAQMLRSRLNSSHVFNVPTRMTYDASRPPINCATPDLLRSNAPWSVQTYEDGCYTQWSWHANKFEAISSFASPCGKKADCSSSKRGEPWAAPDVVVYGYLSCSVNNTREDLCDQLRKAGFKTTCLHQAFGGVLDAFVCSAKVVVVNHYYAEATLETHRIDALLLAKKVVIAAPSSDPTLDALYSKFILFAGKNSMVKTVEAVLSNWDAWNELARRQYTSFVNLASRTDALCYALRHLD